jgi:hypothetical protein
MEICFAPAFKECNRSPDPHGPLLFCLVMRHVSPGVFKIFSSISTDGMALNTSCLDDGIFCHSLGTMAHVIEFLQLSTVNSLGLYLNVEKSSILLEVGVW